VLAATELASIASAANERIAKKNVAAAVERVAARLGNTPAVCRKCYIHPSIVEAYLTGDLARAMRRAKRNGTGRGLSADERRVLAFFDRKLTAKAAEGTAA
jgi:DNA topoisomerase-1